MATERKLQDHMQEVKDRLTCAINDVLVDLINKEGNIKVIVTAKTYYINDTNGSPMRCSSEVTITT